MPVGRSNVHMKQFKVFSCVLKHETSRSAPFSFGRVVFGVDAVTCERMLSCLIYFSCAETLLIMYQKQIFVTSLSCIVAPTQWEHEVLNEFRRLTSSTASGSVIRVSDRHVQCIADFHTCIRSLSCIRIQINVTLFMPGPRKALMAPR